MGNVVDYRDYWFKMKNMLCMNYIDKKELYIKNNDEDQRVRALIYAEILAYMNVIETHRTEVNR